MKTIVILSILLLQGATEITGKGFKRRKSEPIVHLTFESNVTDGVYSENGQSFQIYGNVSFESGVNTGQGLRLHNEGTDVEEAEGLVLADEPEDVCPFNPNKCNEGLTIAFWVKLSSQSQCNAFFEIGQDAPVLENFASPDISLSGVLNDGFLACNVTPHVNPNGTWVHWTFVYLEDSLEVYINGELQPNEVCYYYHNFMDVEGKGLKIGNSGGSCGLDGVLDDFRVYGTALPKHIIRKLTLIPYKIKRKKSDPIVSLSFDTEDIYSGGQYNFIPTAGEPYVDTGVSGNGIRLTNNGTWEEEAQCLILAGEPEDICPFNPKKCTEGITIAFWLQIKSIPVCSAFFSLGQEALFLEDFYGLYLNGVIRDGFLWYEVTPHVQPNDTWVFWTLVYLGSLEDPKVYINGISQDISFYPNFRTDLTGAGLTIGCNPPEELYGPYTCGLNGVIDQFEVYATALPGYAIRKMHRDRGE